MLKRLFDMFLFITASMAIIILLVSPFSLFHGYDKRSIRHMFANQEIAPQRLFIASWRNIKTSYFDPSMNNQDWNKWKYRYLKYIKTDDDVKVAVNTMLASLNDEHSEFYDSKKYGLQEQYIRTYGDTKSTSTTVSIGASAVVKLDIIAGIVNSARVVQGAVEYENPKEGDIIVGINNYPIHGLEMNTAIKLIRGITSFSKVELLRNNKLMTYSINQGVMSIQKVEEKQLEDNIVYISVHTLMGSDSLNFFKELPSKHENASGFIIDLRGDVGGQFLNAVYIADSFIDNGEILTIEYRNGEEFDFNAREKSKTVKKPIVILINKQTASSSEILAGALRSNNRAVLVGEPSYGKNEIQQIIPLPNQTCLNLTTAKYKFGNDYKLTPDGKLMPDFQVDITYDDIMKGNDVQLKKAVEIIKSSIKNSIRD